MTTTTGTSTWLDASVTDLAAAKTFYSGLFGWEFEDLGETFNHYHLIRNDGALVGGLMDVTGMTCPAGDPLVAEWGVYLAVDDVDARAAKVTENGGTVVVPPDAIGDSGRMAIALDATGATIGLWQAGDLEGFEFTGSPGCPVWFELMTHQFDAASAFYTAVFDAHLVAMGEPMEEDSFRYATNGSSDSASWGMCDATGVMPAEATGWRIYFAVEASEPALARVTELGGKILDGPVDSPFGRIATIADPSGSTFQISAMSEAVGEA
ncbi:VOC family protein [Brachybacterium sacelli]|uniref:Enzyme related to lactoylglutathione lyase n=1 Tax=Brachybacterium sacelli TaxID=173364 RepID=A0ABS4X4H5_9MICO|nr:VOC family protein [Brachybacterium sacelli]MBP2383342.1 putative enzyme related to lactoylglutathione lyase [Brachybacterium sacelli]